MPKKFCCFDLQTGAFFMVVATAALGAACFWLSSCKHNLFDKETKLARLYYPLFVGLTLMASSLLLLAGTIKAKPKWIFSYLVLSSTCFFVFTVTVLIFSPSLLWIPMVLWYGQICVNNFYKKTVDSQIFFNEIIATFNGDVTIIHVV